MVYTTLMPPAIKAISVTVRKPVVYTYYSLRYRNPDAVDCSKGRSSESYLDSLVASLNNVVACGQCIFACLACRYLLACEGVDGNLSIA